MMKKMLLFVALLCLSFGLQAQQAIIKVKFLNAKSNKIKLLQPLDGTLFYPNAVEQTFGADSAFSQTFTINKVAWIAVNNYRLLIEPGTTQLTFNYANKDNILTVDRNNAGIQLFFKKNNEFYQSKARKYYKKDTTAAGLLKMIRLDKEAELESYRDLLTLKQISPVFYKEIERYLNMDEAIMQAAIPMIVFSEKRKLNQDLEQMWADAYQKYPLNNIQDSFNPDFYFHARYYADTYPYFLALKRGEKREVKDEETAMKLIYNRFSTSFTGKMKEYLLAYFLYDEMFQSSYQPILVKLFDDFKKQYPQSRFSIFLQKDADKIVAFNQLKQQNLTTKQQIIPNYTHINSFDELLKHFQDKPVFIDVWATWCGPCKEQFQYNAELEKFLASKEIDMLFISTDKDSADEQWRSMIKYYNLEGAHVRTNEKLLKDMMNRFWDGNGYAIPRYILVNKGKVVNANSLRPGDKEKLYAQITKDLAK